VWGDNNKTNAIECNSISIVPKISSKLINLIKVIWGSEEGELNHPLDNYLFLIYVCKNLIKVIWGSEEGELNHPLDNYLFLIYVCWNSGIK